MQPRLWHHRTSSEMTKLYLGRLSRANLQPANGIRQRFWRLY